MRHNEDSDDSKTKKTNKNKKSKHSNNIEEFYGLYDLLGVLSEYIISRWLPPPQIKHKDKRDKRKVDRINLIIATIWYFGFVLILPFLLVVAFCLIGGVIIGLILVLVEYYGS